MMPVNTTYSDVPDRHPVACPICDTPAADIGWRYGTANPDAQPDLIGWRLLPCRCVLPIDAWTYNGSTTELIWFEPLPKETT